MSAYMQMARFDVKGSANYDIRAKKLWHHGIIGITIPLLKSRVAEDAQKADKPPYEDMQETVSCKHVSPSKESTAEGDMKRQRIKYFSPEEKKKLLDFIQKHYPDKLAKRSGFMYKLMFSTGLRLAETVHLNVVDVKDHSFLTIVGKGNKEREIPLSFAIQEEIRGFLEWKRLNGEIIAPDAPLFISRKNRRIGSRGVQHDLDKWVRMAGLEGKYSPHALRHTVGFELMRGTKNIRQVQEFLGHRFITTTQIYTHVTKDELRTCAEMLVCEPGSSYFVFSCN